jgi:tetratricopeptide (TPR) repeat protein
MLSKLQMYCEALMESAWLGAAIVIPLYFNVSSSQTFEPDKVSVLIFFAILSGTACLLKRLTAEKQDRPTDCAGLPFRSLLRHPLVFLVLVLTAIYTLSAIFSITPAASWLGSYRRAQGTIAFYGYVILFLVVLSELRSQDQVKRLQYAFILASLPMAGYGILQYWGADSLPWGNPMGDRSAGSMGNPIFLGAYLVMVIPLTFGRLMEALRMLKAESGRKPGLVLAGTCGFALALQLLALIYTQSRGPILGLVAAIFICFFLVLVLRRTPGNKTSYFPVMAVGLGALAPAVFLVLIRGSLALSPKLGVVGLAVGVVCLAVAYCFLWRTGWGRSWLWLTWLVQAVVLLAIVAAVPANTLEKSLRGSPLHRLTQLSGNSVDVRRSLWVSGLIAIRSGSPDDLPDNLVDRFSILRPIVGYGPENTQFVASRYAVPDVVRVHTKETVDRLHNETIDDLISIGFAGAAAWLIVIGTAFYYALKCLGLCREEGRKVQFILFASMGSLAGFFLPWAIERYPLMGVGPIVGLLIGIIAFATWSGLGRTNPESRGDSPQILVLCILGSVIAHFVESAVGIAVTSTRVYLFILIAILGALSVRDLSRVEEPAKQRSSKAQKQFNSPVLAMTWLSCFVVMVLGYAFMLNRANESSALELFRQVWFTGYSGVQDKLPIPGPLILLLLTISCSLGLIYGEVSLRPVKIPSFPRTAMQAMGRMLAVWLVMAVLTSMFWTAADASIPSSLMNEAETRTTFFFVALLVLSYVLSRQWLRLDATRYSTAVPVRAQSLYFLVPAILIAFAAIHGFVLRPVWADVDCRLAGIFKKSGNLPAAIQSYDRASELAPHVAHYWTEKGLLQASAGGNSPAGLQDSIQSLQHALDLNPLDHSSRNTLAGIYQNAAERSSVAAVRNMQIQSARTLYESAVKLAPNYPDAYCGLGRCYFLLGDSRKAADLYAKSLSMNPYYARTHMYLGEMHFRQNNLELARQEFQMATRLERGNVSAWKNLGFVLALLGQKEEAIQIDLGILPRVPNDTELLCRLSALYFSLGDSSSGHSYARRAYEATPAAKRGTYEQFAADLQQR